MSKNSSSLGTRPSSSYTQSRHTENLRTNNSIPLEELCRQKNNAVFGTERIKFVEAENDKLRQENQALRRELALLKAHPYKYSHIDSASLGRALDTPTSKEIVKKDAYEAHEFKSRLVAITRQCELYEKIIQNMEVRIEKLSERNKKLEEIAQCSLEPNRRKGSKGVIEEGDSRPWEAAMKRVEELAKVCELLELEMRESEEEWERGKEQWRREKSYYLNRIEELEYLARMDKTLKSAREKDRPLSN